MGGAAHGRRAICRGLLQALAFCHGRGVAHGSLGPGSVLLSTFEDRRARELVLKLDNFGFARLHRSAAQSASPRPRLGSCVALPGLTPIPLDHRALHADRKPLAIRCSTHVGPDHVRIRTPGILSCGGKMQLALRVMGARAGTLYPSPIALDPDHPLSLAQREDLKAAGLALLETVICALADGGPSDATSAEALQRLLCDVFSNDMHAFR